MRASEDKKGKKGCEGVMTLVGLMRRSGGWPHSSSGDCGDLELQETDNFSSALTPPQPTSGRPVLWLERGQGNQEGFISDFHHRINISVEPLAL